MTNHLHGPPEREKPGPTPGTGPNHKALADTNTNVSKSKTSGQPEAFDTVAAARRRRQASYRLAGGDPWRRYRGRAGGYPQAVAHLADHGLCAYPEIEELRAMYRAGGQNGLLAQRIAQCWQLAS
jgi:hypothetical protein